MISSPEGSPNYSLQLDERYVIIGDLTQNDRQSLIGPDGLSLYGRRLGMPITYRVEGIESVDVSSEVRDDQVIVGVSDDISGETAGQLDEWLTQHFQDLRAQQAITRRALQRAGTNRKRSDV